MKKILFISSFFIGMFCQNSNAQIFNIQTFAGNGTTGFSGDGGPATSAQLNTPFGTAMDAAGNIYIADQGNCRIRKINTSGIISTVAGVGTPGFSGDGGLATAAELKYPQGVIFDHKGNLYIGDAVNNRIRKVDTAGIITTFAGNGTLGFSGDGGPAILAQMYQPFGFAVDSLNNIYVADWSANRIRKIDTLGIITTVVGSGTTYGFSGDGGLATSAKLHYPDNVSFDAFGNMFIPDTYNHRIRKVNTSNIISTIAGTGSQSYSGDGGLALAADLNDPIAVGADNFGNVYFSDWNNSRVRRIDPVGNISTIAGNGVGGYSGDGGLATSAMVNCVNGLMIDNSSNKIYLADRCNDRIRVLIPINLGINDSVLNNIMDVYPNPGDGIYNLNISIEYGVYDIKIYNVIGELVLELKSQKGGIQIDLCNQPIGIYFVKINNQKQSLTQRIVKK